MGEQPKKTLEDLKKDAEQKQMDFDNQTEFNSTQKETILDENIESSSKSFYKEFKKVSSSIIIEIIELINHYFQIVELSDVIIEVLDARDPLGTRCPQVEQMILNSGRQKKLILCLNKIGKFKAFKISSLNKKIFSQSQDLVPKDNIQKWLKYLRTQYPTIAFKSSTQNQKDKLVRIFYNLLNSIDLLILLKSQSKITIEAANERLLASSKCFGADILLKLLKNYCRNNDIKQTITVGIVG